MDQSKQVKQNWTGPRNFEICFCVYFTVITKVLFILREKNVIKKLKALTIMLLLQ